MQHLSDYYPLIILIVIFLYYYDNNVFDNDLDIATLREDYEKFIREGAKDLPEDVFLQTEQSDPHWRVVFYSNMLAKLRDRHSCYTYCSGYGCKYPHNGLMIDLFVIDSDTNGFLLETYTSRNVYMRFLFGFSKLLRIGLNLARLLFLC